MSAARQMMEARAAKLRAKIATMESELDEARRKLAAVEAKLTKESSDGHRPPLQVQKTGLDMLWEAALSKSRERSSRHRCRMEWNRIPVSERPTLKTMIDALKAWNRSEAWRCDSHMFAPGLHRFIKERMWEDLPEDSRPFVRREVAKPAHMQQRTAEDEAALREFLSLPPAKACLHKVT